MEGFIFRIKPYLWATFWSIMVSLTFGTGWYILFSYDPFISTFELIKNIYASSNFWLGVGIWSVFYSLFITYPIVFLRKKATE